MGHCVKRESEAARLRALRGVYMGRAHGAWLVMLAALLVFDGGRAARPGAERGEAAVVFAARGAAQSGLGEDAVAAELRDMNPALSDRQLARIATAVVKYFWGSEIRGVSYLRQVQEARAAVGRDAES